MSSSITDSSPREIENGGIIAKSGPPGRFVPQGKLGRHTPLARMKKEWIVLRLDNLLKASDNLIGTLANGPYYGLTDFLLYHADDKLLNPYVRMPKEIGSPIRGMHRRGESAARSRSQLRKMT